MKTITILGGLLLVASTAFADSRDINTIVVHHTASPEWTTVEHIDSWHKERGWDGIGYHFVIYSDGTLHRGRDIQKIGAHAKGRNSHSVGISLVGYDNFSTSQIATLHKLIEELKSEYNITSVERHHDKCPGDGVIVEQWS